MNNEPQNQEDQNERMVVDLDYERLATEIVKAINSSKSINVSCNRVYHRFRLKLMRFFNGCFHMAICFLCIFELFNVWQSFSFVSIYNLVQNVTLSIFLLVSAILMFFSQQDSLDESLEETQDFFNTNLALVAIILAVIALR